MRIPDPVVLLAPKVGTSKKIRIRCRSFGMKKRCIAARIPPMHKALIVCMSLPDETLAYWLYMDRKANAIRPEENYQ